MEKGRWKLSWIVVIFVVILMFADMVVQMTSGRSGVSAMMSVSSGGGGVDTEGVYSDLRGCQLAMIRFRREGLREFYGDGGARAFRQAFQRLSKRVFQGKNGTVVLIGSQISTNVESYRDAFPRATTDFSVIELNSQAGKRSADNTNDKVSASIPTYFPKRRFKKSILSSYRECI